MLFHISPVSTFCFPQLSFSSFVACGMCTNNAHSLCRFMSHAAVASAALLSNIARSLYLKPSHILLWLTSEFLFWVCPAVVLALCFLQSHLPCCRVLGVCFNRLQRSVSSLYHDSLPLMYLTHPSNLGRSRASRSCGFVPLLIATDSARGSSRTHRTPAPADKCRT